MRTTGIIRETDKLGRIVLPIELRKSLGINEGDKIEVLTEGNSIILRKQNQTCTFCGSSINIYQFKGMGICAECIDEIRHKTNGSNILR